MASLARIIRGVSTPCRNYFSPRAKSLHTTSLLSPQIHRRFGGFSGPAVTTNVSDGGRVLHLSSQNKGLEMHAVWLRHNCQCPECLSSSGQKTVDPQALNPSNTAISSVEVSGKNVNIEWSCGHHGYIDIKWLNQFVVEKDNELLVAKTLPRISAEEVLSSDIGLWRWLKNLNEYGLCLLTGLPARKGELNRFESAFYTLQSTIYGMISEVVSKESPENIAFTGSPLPLHQDLVYYESPPGIHLLHCLRNDECVEGGLNTMLDSYPVLEELRSKHPRHFETLSTIPATFQKCHPIRAKPVMMKFQRPHISLDSNNEIIAFTWAPQTEAPQWVSKENVVPYYEAYNVLAHMLEDSQHKLYHKLMPGEVLTFNNRRVLHARTEIHLNGGSRLFESTYINVDEFKSKFHVLCTMLGHENYPVKRVFNNCSS